jgi:hypothetical protein
MLSSVTSVTSPVGFGQVHKTLALERRFPFVVLFSCKSSEHGFVISLVMKFDPLSDRLEKKVFVCRQQIFPLHISFAKCN